MMGPVVCSYTSWCPGVLPTLAVMTGHHPVRPGSRGINGVRGHETCQDLLAIRCLTQGQKSRIEVAEEPVEAVIDWQELILITEVVLAKLPRCIPQGLEQFGHGADLATPVACFSLSTDYSIPRGDHVCGKVFVPLQKVGLDSHIRHGNFGETAIPLRGRH